MFIQVKEDFWVVNFADGFNVVRKNWVYQHEEGSLCSKWPGKKTDQEHYKEVKKKADPDPDWEGKLIVEVLGKYGKPKDFSAHKGTIPTRGGGFR